MNPFAEMVRIKGILKDPPLPEPASVCRWCRQPYEKHEDVLKDAASPYACMGLKSEFFEAGVARPQICTKCGESMQTNYGICEKCRRREATVHVDVLLADARKSILDKYRGTTLANIEAAVPPRIFPLNVPVPAVVSRVRAALAGRSPIVLITGGTGAGKTSLASAMLTEVIETGASAKATPIDLERARRARYQHAGDLAIARQEHRLGAAAPLTVREALDASILVIDEFGRDLKTTFDVPKVIHDREAAVKLTIVCTFLLDQAAIAAAYDGGTARRLFDKAIHIELVKARQGSLP